MSLPSLIRPDAGWQLTLCAAAGEAGGSFIGSVRPAVGGGGGPAVDPERSSREAGRRARRRVRLYCVANGLDRLATLTYGGDGCHDQRAVRADLGRFFRGLRDGLGGDALPYLWVPEWHPGGHGLHVHFAVGQYVRRSLIAEAWEIAARGAPGGRVDIRRLSDIPVGASAREPARVAAGYLAKYVAKTFEDDASQERERYLKRYDVAEGFQPVREMVRGRSWSDVLGQVSARMGSAPVRSWLSWRDSEDWQGPPAGWAQWA